MLGHIQEPKNKYHEKKRNALGLLELRYQPNTWIQMDTTSNNTKRIKKKQIRIQTRRRRKTIILMKTKDKLYELRQTIDDLVAIGPDYAHFMNAQIAHKNLKKIKKLLEYIG